MQAAFRSSSPGIFHPMKNSALPTTPSAGYERGESTLELVINRLKKMATGNPPATFEQH